MISAPKLQPATSSRQELSPIRTMRTPTLDPWLVGLTTNGAGIGSSAASSSGAATTRLDDRQAGGAKDDLRGRLVHRQGRGENARMGVGDAQHLENRLKRAVFAADPVQGVKDHVGARVEGVQQGRQVAPDIDCLDPVAVVDERLGAFPPARQRHLALGRPAAHQQCDGFAHPALVRAVVDRLDPGSGRPMRRISHSSTTPDAS